MSTVRIKNSLASLLSSSSSSSSNSNSNNKENGNRPRRRARPGEARSCKKSTYRRFNAVSSFGNLNALAEAARQTLMEGEEHFGQTLSMVKQKSRQGKRRTELRQQQFAWEEEHRALTNERTTLEREILEALGKVAETGLSGPLDEMKMLEAEFANQHKPNTKLQLEAVRRMVQEIDPYEAATVLSEVIEANDLMYTASEQERMAMEQACRETRSALYHTMRGLPEADNDHIVGGTKEERGRRHCPTTRSALWECLSSIQYSKELSDVEFIHSKYEMIVVQLTEHLERTSRMKGQLHQMIQQANQRTHHTHHTSENMDNSDNSDNSENAATTIKKKTIGGWNFDDHQMFVKNWKECVDRGKGHGAFRKRITLLLPHISRDAVSEHIHWFERHRYLQRQIREELVRWKRYMKETIVETTRIIEKKYQDEKEYEARQQELEQMQHHSGKLHTKLLHMKRIYEQKQKVQEMEDEKRHHIQMEEEREKMKAEKIRRDGEKEHVSTFQQERERILQEQKQVEEAKKMRDVELSKAKAPVREARIEHRRTVLAQREEDRKSTMEEAKRKSEDIAAALERLKTQCLYFEKIRDIQENQDPKHVLQVTRAFDAAVKELESLRAAGFGMHARGFAPLNGFQSKTIVGDIRFKLVEQLRSAGLQSTPYAQACIINMSKSMRPMPVHQVSAGFPVWAPRIQP